MLDFFISLGGFIMAPLYWITSLILTGFHSLFGQLFGPESGWAWALSIVGLTLVIRAALIPLFVKQIKSSRNMQLLQPKVKELQKKYGHDRERLAQETMALYKETGTNPFASCLPILLQMPIFLALFRLLDLAAKGQTRGVLTEDQARQFGDSTLFGARIAEQFLGDSAPSVKVLAAVLVIAMTATTFLTQRQLMSKNMPADALSGPYAQQQKMLLYVLPLVFAVGGVAFPIGVLLYWTTSNLWTMAQQFYVIRNNPAPGTPAAKAKTDRDTAKAQRKGHRRAPEAAPVVEPEPEPPRPTQRSQPRKQSRDQRKKQKPKSPPRAIPGQNGQSEHPDQSQGDDPIAPDRPSA
ncbi:MAG: membrane protein insertase YidC [Actinomycetota bacterium]|nr:membrane protein insertase YidC [Actinomycetota bacterium]